jgi:hypothetical protein
VVEILKDFQLDGIARHGQTRARVSVLEGKSRTHELLLPRRWSDGRLARPVGRGRRNLQ